MKLVHVYLNFPGNAEEAMNFYAKTFGTKILMKMTFGETPFVKNPPEAAKNKIMHMQLPITESVHLMASDAVDGVGPGGKLVQGTNFHVSIVANDKAEADRVFAALSEGGKVEMPIGNAPWGPYFGMVADKYGIQWMVSLEKPA